MELTHEVVLRILKIIDESDYDEVRLECGDLKLHVQKQAGTEISAPAVPFGREKTRRPVMAVPAQAANVPNSAVRQPSQSSTVPVPEGMIAVRAPMLGTFYRSPSPGEKPFVEVGDKVNASDTVCLVEVMKLFNSVSAGVDGTVVKIVVENASMVEFDQPLVIIDPA